MTEASPKQLDVRTRIANINSECAGVWGQTGISYASRAFMDRLAMLPLHYQLSEKQERWLCDIERRAFNLDAN